MDGLLTPTQLVLRVSVALLLLLALGMVCSLVGTESVSWQRALTEGPGVEGGNMDYDILMTIRLPRVLLAMIVGGALAMSGVVFQGLLRNPLAEPYILGVSSGAGLGAILAVLMGFTWTVWGRSPMAVYAFLGAIGTVWLVSVIGRYTGKHHITGLLLAGVVVNAFFSAMIMFLTTIANSNQVHATIFWLMGNMQEAIAGQEQAKHEEADQGVADSTVHKGHRRIHAQTPRPGEDVAKRVVDGGKALRVFKRDGGEHEIDPSQGPQYHEHHQHPGYQHQRHEEPHQQLARVVNIAQQPQEQNGGADEGHDHDRRQRCRK